MPPTQPQRSRRALELVAQDHALGAVYRVRAVRGWLTRSWKLVVLQEGAGATLNLLHKETLPRDVSPDVRMRTLATDIAEGWVRRLDG